MPRILLLLVCAALQAFAAGQNAAAGPPLTLTLDEAQARARANAPQLLSANIASLMAAEDRLQAKASLLPTVNWVNQAIFTERNGSPSGVFISNDGPHVYNNQAQAHADLYAPGKRAEYQRAIAAEAVAKAKAEVAVRGLAALVTQNYYALAAAQRKTRNASQSQREAEEFLSLTDKLEQGGEAARADVVKARIQVSQRQREAAEAQLEVDKSRIEFAVLLFPDFRHDYSVVDDLDTVGSLPTFDETQARAAKENPDIRAAQHTVRQETLETKVARSALLPTFSVDYFFGINANQYAIHNPDGQRLVGSAVQASLTVPVWTWGATRSKIRQADLRLRQAKSDLTLTQRQLLANLNAFYLEAQAASSQLATLRETRELSAESLRLTLLRYEAGEAAALEVVDAQTTLAQARNAYDDGLVRRRLALSSLQTLTGAF
jgi:outer membrane protein TolC